MAKVKKAVTLSGPQVEYLESRAKELDITFSELLRRIVDEHREQRHNGQNDGEEDGR